MIGKALSSDLLKIRGKGIWFLAILGPVGLIAMQALNYGLRYDYLTSQYAENLWGALLSDISMFVPIALLLGITLVSSLIANVEHTLSSWKQLLALPISRTTVFAAKFLMTVIILTFSCVLLVIGTVVLGFLLKFDTGFSFMQILKLCFLPFIASFPVLALMLWLCLTYKNQAMPITIGVVMSIFSIVAVSEWMPFNWPLFSYQGPHEELFVGAGLICGFVIYVIGSIHFSRKDVN